MRFALVNPEWKYDGSIYFGCREPHLPLELGYAEALLKAAGHEPILIDAHMEGLSVDELKSRAAAFAPDFTVIATAPGYLFWRCPPPELKSPMAAARALKGISRLIAIGPHGSVTPGAVLKKLEADAVILGEPEEIIPLLSKDLRDVPSLAFLDNGRVVATGAPHASDMAALPPLAWEKDFIRLHRHNHHRFGGGGCGPGAEMEASRGCPFSCTFCARGTFRERYRKRPFDTVEREMDALIAAGATYIYFIDEIFMPDEKLLSMIAGKGIRFGVQTRIDLWSEETVDMLGEAGCVSIEAGIESITGEGRALLGKEMRMGLDNAIGLLARARKKVPFVQATLVRSESDDPAAVDEWRGRLRSLGVWSNEPVPLFPYPGSRDYQDRWGAPDEYAWERAHGHYISENRSMSDIQESEPLPIKLLEG